MKRLICIFLLGFFLSNSFCQVNKPTKARIQNTTFKLENNKVIINYDIVNASSGEKFDINVKIKTYLGNEVDAKTFQGDLKNVTPGLGKTITWEISKDFDHLNANIYVELEAVNVQIIPYTSKGKALLLSTVYPGWGSSRVSIRKWPLFKGVLTYGGIGVSSYFYFNAIKNYDNYLLSMDIDERSNYLVSTREDYHLARNIIFGVAALYSTEYLTILLSKNRTMDTQNSIFNNMSFNVQYDPKFDSQLLSFRLNF